MKVCLIVNPNAGRRRGLEAGRLTIARLREHGHETTELISDAPGGTARIARGVDAVEWDAILAVGGDGTLFEVVNGLLERSSSIPVPLGQIPVGTGNSFARDLGITDVDGALEAVLAGRTRRVDLGHFSSNAGDYYFVNLLGAGFVSNVARRARRFKALGSLSYALAVLGEVVGLRSVRISLTLDDEIIDREAIFVEVCNSRYTGGTMMMAPDASIDDGLFDVVVADRMTRRSVLRLLPTIFSGRHVHSPYVTVYQSKRVRLRADAPLALTPDGETFGETPIDVTLVPGALEMYAR